MDQSQVIFEYGKLQLNFVASQQQVAQLGTLLANANKEIAELKKKLAEYTDDRKTDEGSTAKEHPGLHVIPTAESVGA